MATPSELTATATPLIGTPKRRSSGKPKPGRDARRPVAPPPPWHAGSSAAAGGAASPAVARPVVGGHLVRVAGGCGSASVRRGPRRERPTWVQEVAVPVDVVAGEPGATRVRGGVPRERHRGTARGGRPHADGTPGAVLSTAVGRVVVVVRGLVVVVVLVRGARRGRGPLAPSVVVRGAVVVLGAGEPPLLLASASAREYAPRLARRRRAAALACRTAAARAAVARCTAAARAASAAVRAAVRPRASGLSARPRPAPRSPASGRRPAR